MSTPLEKVLECLRQHGRDPAKNGKGWKARCPAHEDTNPSLSIGQGDDGRVLLHCHTGCDHRSVMTGLGLTDADLLPPNLNGQGHTAGRKPKGLFDTYEADRDWLASKGGSIAGEWKYGSSFRVARFNNPDGSKEFKPFRREAGGWRIKKPDGKLPLLSSRRTGGRADRLGFRGREMQRLGPKRRTRQHDFGSWEQVGRQERLGTFGWQDSLPRARQRPGRRALRQRGRRTARGARSETGRQGCAAPRPERGRRHRRMAARHRSGHVVSRTIAG